MTSKIPMNLEMINIIYGSCNKQNYFKIQGYLQPGTFTSEYKF